MNAEDAIIESEYRTPTTAMATTRLGRYARSRAQRFEWMVADPNILPNGAASRVVGRAIKAGRSAEISGSARTQASAGIRRAVEKRCGDGACWLGDPNGGRAGMATR